MYLKFSVDAPLDELVRSLWPEVPRTNLLYDYENVYEWVWLSLPLLGIRLNISREHGWGEDSSSKAIYVSAFQLERDEHIDALPEGLAERIARTQGCSVHVFSGRANVDEEDGEPVEVLDG